MASRSRSFDNYSPSVEWNPREMIAVTCGALIFGALFSVPLLGHLSESSFFFDWDRFHDLDWTAAYIVTHFLQFPLWSPYQCGGIQLLANPESRILTPFFPLHLLMGSTIGINLEVPFHLAIAWAGGYLLGRAVGVGKLAAAACATVFPSSSWFYLHFGVGHLSFLAFAYTPAIVGFTLLAIERKRLTWSAVAGALLTLAFFEGGVYPVVETALLVAFLSSILACEKRGIWPPVACLVAGLFTVGLAAPKLFPMLSIGNSRATGSYQEWLSLGGYAASLFSRNQDRFRLLQWAGVGVMPIFQCGAYLSPPFLSASLIGIGAFPRRSAPWLILFAAFLIFGMGDWFGQYSPWVLAHRLPIFSWLAVSPKFFVMLPMCLAVLTGFGVEFLAGWRGRAGLVLALILFAAGTVDTWLIGPPNLTEVGSPLEALPASPVFREFQDATDQQMLRVNLANMGIANCYVEMATRGYITASNRPGYKGEQYLLGPGSVTLERWSPEALEYGVDVKSPTVMVVNQNYDSSWRLVRGQGEVFSYQGLLAARLPSGSQRLELRYRSYPFLVGLIVSLVTGLIALLVIRSERRRDGIRPPFGR